VKKVIATLLSAFLFLLILVLMILFIPWLTFWSLKQLFNIEIIWGWKTVPAFWILYFVFKGSFTLEKRETTRIGSIEIGANKGFRW